MKYRTLKGFNILFYRMIPFYRIISSKVILPSSSMP